jgi:hypothetical protein
VLSMSIIEFSARFLKALDEKNDSKIKQVYSDWAKELKNQPLWSSKNSGDEFWRCLWKEAEDAFTEKKEIFNSSGLYFFGKDKEILYIGRTGGKLKNRLRKRYFGPKSETPNKRFAQFNLAEKYEDILKKKGYEALPEDVRSWYKHNYGKNTKVRLEHAEELAKEGIHDIWFGVLPLKKKEYIEQLETKLIKIENPRLNTQKKI